jgi:hypothetical protein
MTFPIVDQLDSAIGGLASSIGKPEGKNFFSFISYILDQIRLMICMYMGYPLGSILNLFVRGKALRHLFAAITGFLL